MIPTPDLSHLTSEDYDVVYEPAGMYQEPPGKKRKKKRTSPLIISPLWSLFTEDTFLFLDALESDANDLKESRALICLEIG